MLAILQLAGKGPTFKRSLKAEAWRSGSVVTSGSEEHEFEPHSGSDEVTLFPPSVYHHYGDSYDGGSYQSIGLTVKLPQPD